MIRKDTVNVQARARQRKEYEALMSERDLIGTQLVRRNDEVALLYAKLRLQGSSLQVRPMHQNTQLTQALLFAVRLWCSRG